MQGKILDYNSEFKSGLIRGEDGNKYRFSIDDCKSDLKPRTNSEVDFEPNEDKAVEVYILTRDTLDDIKDATTSTVNTAVITARKSKKYIPIVIVIIILAALLVYVFGEYLPEKQKAEVAKQELLQDHTERTDLKQKVSLLLLEADKYFNQADYKNAILKYEKAKVTDTISVASIHTGGDYFLYHIRTDVFYNNKIANAYLKMNQPEKALSILGNLEKLSPYQIHKASSGLFKSDGVIPAIPKTYEFTDENEVAMAFIMAYKAYKLKDNMAEANKYADWACKAGDCSLLEK